jgi:hypothetical protein
MKANEDIKKELSEIAPVLSGLKKPVCDTVPEGYFTQFRYSILDLVKEEAVREELKQVAPSLANIQKPINAQVPEMYFTDFRKQMLEVVKAEQITEARHLNSWMHKLNVWIEQQLSVIFQPRYTLAFAGSFSVVLVAVMLSIKIQQCTDLDCKFASLTSSELDAYITSNSDEFSPNKLEFTNDESTSLSDFDPIEKGIDLYEPTQQELENALLD